MTCETKTYKYIDITAYKPDETNLDLNFQKGAVILKRNTSGSSIVPYDDRPGDAERKLSPKPKLR